MLFAGVFRLFLRRRLPARGLRSDDLRNRHHRGMIGFADDHVAVGLLAAGVFVIGIGRRLLRASPASRGRLRRAVLSASSGFGGGGRAEGRGEGAEGRRRNPRWPSRAGRTTGAWLGVGLRRRQAAAASPATAGFAFGGGGGGAFAAGFAAAAARRPNATVDLFRTSACGGSSSSHRSAVHRTR